jgi:hypothetical protein
MLQLRLCEAENSLAYRALNRFSPNKSCGLCVIGTNGPFWRGFGSVGGCAWVEVRQYGYFVLSAQFFCEAKPTLKNKIN